MANFSSLKNVPDLFQPQNLEKAGQFLRQPLALAVLASLGAHALLAISLPLWSASGQKQPDRRPVSVVELSPLEQARLPQSDLSKALSPLPKTTRKSDKSSKTKSVDPLGTVGILGTPSNPPAPDATALYTIPPEYLAPPSSLSATSSVSPKRSTPKKVEPSKEVEKKPSVEVKEDTAQKTTGAGRAKEDSTNNAPSTRARDLKLPEATAQGQETEAKNPANLFAFNAENTSEEDFQKNAVNFSNYAIDVAQGDLQDDWKKLDAVTAPYPKQACQFKYKDEVVKGEPWFGVIVKPDGTIAAKPMLLRSSGFKGLDKAAAEFVAKQKFEPAKKYQGLYFPVKLAPTAADCTATNPDKPASDTN